MIIDTTDKGDREAAAALREVRYWRARRASAEVVKPPADKSTASFGMTVSLRRVDGRRCSLDCPRDPSHHPVGWPLEGRSMIVGAFALALCSWTVCVLLKKFLLSSWTATMAALIVWFAVALGASAALFQLS